MKSIFKPLAVAATFAAAPGVCAQELEFFDYTDGNLILGFQATSGLGSDKNVFFDLGSGVGFRDNGNQGALGNIGTTLSLVFGNGWHTRADLYFGVVGNLNQNPNTGIGSRAPVQGDPSRTFYISAPATTPGTGLLRAAGSIGGPSLGLAGSRVSGMENLLASVDDSNGWRDDDPDELARGFYQQADGAGILDQSLAQHNVAWQNGWTWWNPTPGAAFDVFTGGIQQSFAGSASEKHVDIQRILSTNTGAQPEGVVGGGTYVTTISISSSGQITALKAGGGSGSSQFEAWVGTFPQLVASPDPADREPEGDYDKDGANNLMEFALGGSPVDPADNGASIVSTADATGNSEGDLTLTIQVRSSATFSASGPEQTATVDGVVYRVQGTGNLSDFTSAVSEVTPHLGSGTPKTGYEFKTFRLVASGGLPGKGFLRVVIEEAAGE